MKYWNSFTKYSLYEKIQLLQESFTTEKIIINNTQTDCIFQITQIISSCASKSNRIS